MDMCIGSELNSENPCGFGSEHLIATTYVARFEGEIWIWDFRSISENGEI